jgi:hypothetical protein
MSPHTNGTKTAILGTADTLDMEPIPDRSVLSRAGLSLAPDFPIQMACDASASMSQTCELPDDLMQPTDAQTQLAVAMAQLTVRTTSTRCAMNLPARQKVTAQP